jgi:uncharacterized membrane protein YuzA (DUF378 family)
MDLYSEKKIYMVLMFVVLFGALNLGIGGILNTNLFEKLDGVLNFSIFENIKISRILYVTIGLASLYFITNRDVYLPFLGESVYPCDSLKEHTPKDATEVERIKVSPYALVVYWAAEPKLENKKNAKNPWIAYQNYENYGIVRADENGEAILKFRKPRGYKVPSGKTIKPHVHYRYCKYPGILSKIYTKYIF